MRSIRPRLLAALAVACLLVAFGGRSAMAQTVPPAPPAVTQSPVAPTGSFACNNATAAPFFAQGEVGGLVVGSVPVTGVGQAVPNVVAASSPLIQVCSGFTTPDTRTKCDFDYDSPTGPVASQFSGEPPQKVPFDTSAGVAFDQVGAVDPDTAATLRDATAQIDPATTCTQTSTSATPDVPYTPPAVFPGASTVPGRAGSNLGTAAPIIVPGPITFVDVTTGQVLSGVGGQIDSIGSATSGTPGEILGIAAPSSNPLNPSIDGLNGLTAAPETPTPISSVALTSNGGWIAFLSILMVCLCALFAWLTLERGGKKRGKQRAAAVATAPAAA